jgi:hypothetical protein
MATKYPNTTSPERTAAIIGAVDTSSNASTDWTDLTSADFKSTTTGSAVAAGKIFSYLTIHNTSTTASAFLKFRARDGAGDTTSAELEIPATMSIGYGMAGMEGGPILTIAYRKAAAGDELVIQAGFEAATI